MRERGRLLSAPAAAIAIGFGLLTLLGLIVGEDLGVLNDLLNNPRYSVRAITDVLLQITVITAALTVIIGVLNLLAVHSLRIRRRSGGWPYSIVLIVSALAVIILTILERSNTLRDPVTPLLLENVQVSIESALSGLLVFALVYGGYRALRRGVSFWGLLFVATLLVVLAGYLPLPGLTLLADFRQRILDLPVSAGARGILLGIALATVVTGVRVLTGQDRSYRE
jgi:uncharacterized membrane protein (DUF485 family)